MYRNDPLLPCLALVIALILGWAAYWDGHRMAVLLVGRPPQALSVGQIGLVTFALVFVVYGMIGLLSVWLDGTDLQPGRHVPKPRRGMLVMGMALALALSAASGLFVRDILNSLETGRVHPGGEGATFGAMALLSALLLAFYKKYVVGEDVIAEDEHSEVPW